MLRLLRRFPGFAWALLTLLASNGCSTDRQEPDNAQTRYEFEVQGATPWPGAIVEVEAGVFAVIGTRLVYVPSATGASGAAAAPPMVIQEAPRLHDALATDDTYVYYATQKAERFSFFQPRSETGPAKEPDGNLYRVSKKPPFAPEVVTPVGILTGRIASQGGHLYMCESPGSNGEGSLVDVSVKAPPSATRWPFRFNEYCRGVVADDANLFLMIDRSHKTDIGAGGPRAFEKALVLSTAPRNATPPWAQAAGPTVVKVLDPSLGLDQFYLRSETLVAVSQTQATLFTKGGEPASTFVVTARNGGKLVPDGAAWFWAQNANGGAEFGRICENGRIYGGVSPATGRELTQNVCAVDAMAAGPSGVWFVEHANIFDPKGGPDTYRYRIKLVRRPEL